MHKHSCFRASSVTQVVEILKHISESSKFSQYQNKQLCGWIKVRSILVIEEDSIQYKPMMGEKKRGEFFEALKTFIKHILWCFSNEFMLKTKLFYMLLLMWRFVCKSACANRQQHIKKMYVVTFSFMSHIKVWIKDLYTVCVCAQ